MNIQLKNILCLIKRQFHFNCLTAIGRNLKIQSFGVRYVNTFRKHKKYITRSRSQTSYLDWNLNAEIIVRTNNLSVNSTLGGYDFLWNMSTWIINSINLYRQSGD